MIVFEVSMTLCFNFRSSFGCNSEGSCLNGVVVIFVKGCSFKLGILFLEKIVLDEVLICRVWTMQINLG